MKNNAIAAVLMMTAGGIALYVFPAQGQEEGATSLPATREWVTATAAAEGLYPGGMGEAPERLWTLYIEGVTSLQSWDLETAEKSLTKALKFATRDSERIAVYHALATVYFRAADLKASRANVDKAVKIADAEGDSTALAYVLKDASQIYRMIGDTSTALALATRGSEVAAAIDNPLWRASYQLSAAGIAFEMDDVPKGAALVEEAAPVFDTTSNKLGTAHVIFWRGYVKYRHGEFDDAVTLCRAAVEEYKLFDDRHSEGQALNVIGVCLSAQKDYDGALQAHMLALEIYRSLRDRICEASTLLQCAGLFYVWGQYDSAVTACDEALAIGREYEATPIVTEALRDRAAYFAAQGNARACLKSLEEARKTATTASDEDSASARRIDYGVAVFGLLKGGSNVDRAIKDLKAVEKRCDAAGDVELAPGICEVLAKAYTAKGDVGKALAYRRKLVDLRLASGDSKAAAQAFNDLGFLLLEAGRYDESIVASRRAIELYEELGDRDGEGFNYRGIGLCYIKFREYDKAVIELEKAAELHHGTGNGPELGRDYLYLCALAWLKGDEVKAKEFEVAAKKLIHNDKLVKAVIFAVLIDAKTVRPLVWGPGLH